MIPRRVKINFCGPYEVVRRLKKIGSNMVTKVAKDSCVYDRSIGRLRVTRCRSSKLTKADGTTDSVTTNTNKGNVQSVLSSRVDGCGGLAKS